MTMNPLPPQAYTKETMLKAYQWLMVQSSSIKEMATTPDILVSLYLKATRDGSAALDRPSIQNFKNELKSLAGIMGELERPESKEVAPPSVKSPAPPPPKLEITKSLDSCSLEMIQEVKVELNLSSDLEALRLLIKVGYGRAKSLLR